MKTRALLLFYGMVLTGCASMSVEECATADWRALGFSDGARGETLSRAQRRSNDCTDHGYTMDRAAYDEGRHAGLGQYCTADTAYRLGESGRSYNGVCSSHDERSFLAAYDRGLQLHRFTSAASSAEANLKSARSRHSELDTQLDRYSDGYRDEDLTTEEHNEMVLELWAERKYLEDEAIPYWIYAHRYLEEELENYRARISANDPDAADLRPREFPGPEPFEGATRDDAREMLREVLGALQN